MDRGHLIHRSKGEGAKMEESIAEKTVRRLTQLAKGELGHGLEALTVGNIQIVEVRHGFLRCLFTVPITLTVKFPSNSSYRLFACQTTFYSKVLSLWNCVWRIKMEIGMRERWPHWSTPLAPTPCTLLLVMFTFPLTLASLSIPRLRFKYLFLLISLPPLLFISNWSFSTFNSNCVVKLNYW